MTLLNASIYGERFAAAKQCHPTMVRHYLAQTAIFDTVIRAVEVHPELGAPAMTVLAGSAPPAYTTVTPWPVDGQASIVMLIPTAGTVFGAQLAASVGAPPSSYYESIVQTLIDILTDSIVLAAGLIAPAPPGGGPLLGSVRVQTTKPSDVYAAKLVLDAKCPPASSHAKDYFDTVGVMFDMLRDAEVLGSGFVAPVPPPPVVPPAVPPPSVPLPIGGIGRIT